MTAHNTVPDGRNARATQPASERASSTSALEMLDRLALPVSQIQLPPHGRAGQNASAVENAGALSLAGEPQARGFQQPRSMREIIEQVTKEPERFAELPEALKTEAVCLAAIGKDARCMRHVPDELLENKNFVLRALAENPRAYSFLNSDRRQDRTYALEALSQDGALVRQLPGELINDYQFNLSAVKANPAVFFELPEHFRTNSKFILAAVAENANCIDSIPDTILENAPELLEEIALSNLLAESKLRGRLQTLSPELEANFEKMRSAHEVLEIDPLGPDVARHGHTRGVFDNSREIIRNRYSVADDECRERLEQLLGKRYFAGVQLDTRPVALVVYPRTDHNGAFQQGGPGIWRGGRNAVDALTNEYRVIYFQAADSGDVVAAIDQASQDGRDQIRTFLLAGHGQPGSIQLSEHGHLSARELDEFSNRRHCFEPGGQLLLFSCSTGKLLEHNQPLCPVGVMLNSHLEHLYVVAPSDPIVPYLWVSPATKVTRMQGHDELTRRVPCATFPPIDDFYSDKPVKIDLSSYPEPETLEKIRRSIPSELHVVADTSTTVELRQYAHRVTAVHKDPGWEFKMLELMLEKSIGNTLASDKFANFASRWKIPRDAEGYLSDQEVDVLKSALKTDLGYDGPIRVRFEHAEGYTKLHILRPDERPLCSLTFLTDSRTGRISETVSNRLFPSNF